MRSATPRASSTSPRPCVMPMSASRATSGRMRSATTAPASRPMAGAATRSGSTPIRPRTAPLSGAPNWRSCQRPTAATTRSARSSPTRSTTPLLACRPRRARRATKERPWRSEGRARASAHAPAVTAATSWASGVTRGAIVRPISWSGPAALKMPSAATAMSGAAIAIGTARTSASSSAAAPSCPAPAPRARRRAVSPRRCSMSRPAVRTRAYPASTASWTASTVTLICATTSERLAASSAAPSEVTTVTCEVAIVDRRRPSSPSSSLEMASRRPATTRAGSGKMRHATPLPPASTTLG